MLRATTTCNFSSLIWPDGSAPARFSEPTFRPSRATTHWKNRVNRDFSTFSRVPASSFFWLSSSLIFFLSSPLWFFPPLLFHLSILSEVWLLNFLRLFLQISCIFYVLSFCASAPATKECLRSFGAHYVFSPVLSYFSRGFAPCQGCFFHRSDFGVQRGQVPPQDVHRLTVIQLVPPSWNLLRRKVHWSFGKEEQPPWSLTGHVCHAGACDILWYSVRVILSLCDAGQKPGQECSIR